MISALVVLGAIALIQLLELPFRSTASHSIFRLAVVNAKGEPAAMSHLLVRWAIVWLPLFLPMSFVALLIQQGRTYRCFHLRSGIASPVDRRSGLCRYSSQPRICTTGWRAPGWCGVESPSTSFHGSVLCT